jgi:hypothetical protein
MRNTLTAAIAALCILGSTGLASAQVVRPVMMHPAGSSAKKKPSQGGTVNLSGQIVNGTGFTVTHDGTGKYTLDIPSGFKGCPVVMVTPAGANGDIPIVNDYNYITCGNGEVKIQIAIFGRSSGNYLDNSFNFLVISP